MPLLLALVGLGCIAGGIGLIAAPLRVLRLPAHSGATRELRLLRGLGVLLLAAGSFLLVTALGPQRPVLPSVPTPTPLRRLV